MEGVSGGTRSRAQLPAAALLASPISSTQAGSWPVTAARQAPHPAPTGGLVPACHTSHGEKCPWPLRRAQGQRAWLQPALEEAWGWRGPATLLLHPGPEWTAMPRRDFLKGWWVLGESYGMEDRGLLRERDLSRLSQIAVKSPGPANYTAPMSSALPLLKGH